MIRAHIERRGDISTAEAHGVRADRYAAALFAIRVLTLTELCEVERECGILQRAHLLDSREVAAWWKALSATGNHGADR